MIKPKNFESKESYVQWREQWRKTYAFVSQFIRMRREDLKTLQRGGNFGGVRICHYTLINSKHEAFLMMAELEAVKAIVRARLRLLGFDAPDPKVREKPAPRPKHKFTPEEISQERAAHEHRGRMAQADAHSD